MGRGEEKRGGKRRGGEQGRRAGEGRSPNVRDALTPLVESTASPNCSLQACAKQKNTWTCQRVEKQTELRGPKRLLEARRAQRIACVGIGPNAAYIVRHREPTSGNQPPQ